MVREVALPRQEFRGGRWRWFGPVALGALMAAAGAYLLWRDASGEQRSLAWSALGSGAVLALWFGSPFWRRAPVLWFDARGLSAALPGSWPIVWADIEMAQLVRVGRRCFLAVDRTAAARLASPAVPLLRQFAQRAGADDIALPLDGLEHPPDRVAAVIALAHQHACELCAAQPGQPGAGAG